MTAQPYNRLPYIVPPELADEIGLREATIIQQLRLWQNETHEEWVTKSLSELNKAFSWCCPRTLYSLLDKMKVNNQINVRVCHNEKCGKIKQYQPNGNLYKTGGVMQNLHNGYANLAIPSQSPTLDQKPSSTYVVGAKKISLKQEENNEPNKRRKKLDIKLLTSIQLPIDSKPLIVNNKQVTVNDKQLTVNVNDKQLTGEGGEANKHLTIDYEAEAKEVQRYFNEKRKKRTKSFAFLKNYIFWRATYSFADILEAIDHIKWSKFFAKIEDLDLVLIFRRRNPRGEEVDYIGKLLNTEDPDKDYWAKAVAEARGRENGN